MPNDTKEVQKVRNRVARFFEPLLRCLSSEEAQYVPAKVHEGVCGSHMGGKELATEVIQAGYY